MKLKDLCLITEATRKKSLVGVAMGVNMPHVYFPLEYRLPDENDDDDIRKCAIDLLFVIEDCKRKHANEGDLADESLISKSHWPIWAYNTLISAFIESEHLYQKSHTICCQSNNGKISWRETTKNCIRRSSLIILPSHIVKRKLQFISDSEIALVHKYCLQISLAYIGWIYRIEVDRASKCNMPFTKDYCLQLIDKEFKSTNIDSNLLLLRAMRDIIAGDTGFNSHRQAAIGTKSFHVVWEMLVREVFGNEDEKRYFAGATWLFISDKKQLNTHNLRPDCAMKSSRDLFIIDAKYYKPSAKSAHLPQIADINKQVSYGAIASHVIANSDINIYNVYAMCAKLESGKHMEIVATADPEWLSKESINELHYARVYAVNIDTRWLIETYIGQKQNKDSAKQELAALILQAQQLLIDTAS